MDKFKTCQGCSDRSLKCRGTCEGWAFREQKKLERYRARELEAAGSYVSIGAVRASRRKLNDKKSGRLR